MENRGAIKALLSGIPQFAATMAVVVPALVWFYNFTASAADAKARAYIQLVVDSRFDTMETKLEELTASINRLVRGQTAETSQSAEEARINRQILCLQALVLDPTSGTQEGCMNIP